MLVRRSIPVLSFIRCCRALALGIAISLHGAPLLASSMAVATGNATVDGRAIMWKNRDHWSTPDGWKVHAYNYVADASSFGSGDRYTSRFNYLGVTAQGSSGVDPVAGTAVPWAGANDRGLLLTQVAGHTLTSQFAQTHGYPVSQDLTNGMSGGYLNHIVLSRCEHVDEVEQFLRDTNDGGGFSGSFARNTSTMISVADRWGNSAVFEIDGDSFTRDNITSTYAQDANGNYSASHADDKDALNPSDGAYSGFDWRNNFSKVVWSKANGFPYFVDNQITTVEIDPVTGNDHVANSGTTPDGVHDWEDSTSAVMRYARTGLRMDDPHLKDYRYFIHKYVGSNGIGQLFDIETLSKNIGDLPYAAGEKPTGYHLNRFASTFGSVFVGSKAGDPYDGKLAAAWIGLGEPTVSLFVPVFPYANALPTEIADMYATIDAKRHLVYSYTNDDADGYSGGRNADHSIDTVALAGSGGYYGAGGVQKYTFAIEDWAFDQFDGFMTDLRIGSRTLAQLQTDLREWQANIIPAMKNLYSSSQWPNSFEAESWANALTGSTRRVRNSNMSWGGKVIDIGPGSDLTIQKVRVDGAGAYRVDVHYTTSTNRELDLSVNGGAATTLQFAASGGPDVLAIKTISVALGGGDNSLRFFNDSTSVTPGVDRIEIANPEVIVDNADAGFTKTGSGWNSNTTFPGYWGSDYLSDGTSGADGSSKRAKWTPDIPVAGSYKVYMRWTSNANRPDTAPIEIRYDGGLDTSKTVNQQINGGQWVEIGIYPMTAGTGNHVLLRCTDPGYTIADAVRFEKQM
ncbi:MAG: hypothetical protein ACREV5_10490 [Steroidobacter sp.]